MRLYKQLRKEEEQKTKEKRKGIHLNAEFHRIARRYKKGFLSDQCKEIEENSRMAKTRDRFKKITDTKDKHKIKDRNGMDKQKQKILKRGGKNTQKNYTKKIVMTQITMMV